MNSFLMYSKSSEDVVHSVTVLLQRGLDHFEEEHHVLSGSGNLVMKAFTAFLSSSPFFLHGDVHHEVHDVVSVRLVELHQLRSLDRSRPLMRVSMSLSDLPMYCLVKALTSNSISSLGL